MFKEQKEHLEKQRQKYMEAVCKLEREVYIFRSTFLQFIFYLFINSEKKFRGRENTFFSRSRVSFEFNA